MYPPQTGRIHITRTRFNFSRPLTLLRILRYEKPPKPNNPSSERENTRASARKIQEGRNYSEMEHIHHVFHVETFTLSMRRQYVFVTDLEIYAISARSESAAFIRFLTVDFAQLDLVFFFLGNARFIRSVFRGINVKSDEWEKWLKL